jgi:hypothetical protein
MAHVSSGARAPAGYEQPAGTAMADINEIKERAHS